MLQLHELELKNRMRGPRPVVVCVTRRKLAASDALVRALARLPTDLRAEIDLVSVDADANPRLMDDLAVRFVPELLVLARGRVIERATGDLATEHILASLKEALATIADETRAAPPRTHGLA